MASEVGGVKNVIPTLWLNLRSKIGPGVPYAQGPGSGAGDPGHQHCTGFKPLRVTVDSSDDKGVEGFGAFTQGHLLPHP